MGAKPDAPMFALASLACGLAYWLQADWRIYVDRFNGRLHMFPLPWWWQFGESALVGLLAGGCLTTAYQLLRKMWPRNGSA